MTRASASGGSPSHLRGSAADAAAHARGIDGFLRNLSGLKPGAADSSRRVAVVGSGIAGLSAAWALSRHARVTLYESNGYFGGHTHTVDMQRGGRHCGVDTGFLVFNERTYPLLIQLFGQLGVEVAKSEMSFSVQAAGLEWSGNNLNSLFAQRRNLLRRDFWRMLADLVRFNTRCTALAREGTAEALAQPVGEFLREHHFSTAFQDWYLLPMVACIWSCPTEQMLAFPISTLIRFCHNHGLLQISQRPQWFTVRGGARHYVDKLVADIPDARLSTPVLAVRRGAGVSLRTAAGTEQFDAVVMASHSDRSLKLLADPTPQERQLLGAIGYHRNRAVLHTDASLLPQRQRAWAAWNYEHGGAGEAGAVCLHYLLNRLQPLPWADPTVVSLNPVRPPDPALVLGEYDYAHPVFDQAAIQAQLQLPTIQGRDSTWFCGAWTRYGFHEDGLLSGLRVAQQMVEQWERQSA